MDKYIVTFSSPSSEKTTHTGAYTKAPADIEAIALQQNGGGYKALPLTFRKANTARGKIVNWLSILCQLVVKSARLPKSVVLIQFPQIHPFVLRLALPLMRKHYIVSVLHDIDSIRVGGSLSSNERTVLSYAQELYVHSENMRAYFETRLRKGIKYHVLDCFPYIAQPNKKPRYLSNEVCFAGNLDKSVFLEKFIKSEDGINLILYGNWKNNVADQYGHVSYLGCFTSENVQNLEGSWGLVWDGDSLEACSGNWGEYLKIIAPHKFSMYLVAELPVIVWKESAMAHLVEQHNLGITINSLSELTKRINRISPEEYASMIANIRNYRNSKHYSF